MSNAIHLLAILFAILHGADPNAVVPVARASQVALCRVYTSSQKPAREGTLDLSIARTRRGVATVYANAVADLNGDGSIAPYELTGDRKQQEWIVRNVPLPVSGEGHLRPEFSIWFKFNDLSIKEGQMRRVAVILTDEPLDVMSQESLDDLVAWDVEALLLQATGWGVGDQRGQRLTAHSVSPSRARAAGDTVLNAAAEGPGVPDIDQQFNECGPTSAANSLLWLGGRYGFLGKLPEKEAGVPDTARLILDLMNAMAGTADRPFKGLKGNQMYTGLRAYVESIGLPLEVAGGNSNPASRGPAAFDFISQHLSRRQPAELLIWMPDGSGHWVTITGCARQDSRAILFVHDPDDKKTTTAVWELSVGRNGKPDGGLILPAHCALGWAVAKMPVENRLQAENTAQPSRRSASSRAERRPLVYSLDVD